MSHDVWLMLYDKFLSCTQSLAYDVPRILHTTILKMLKMIFVPKKKVQNDMLIASANSHVQ